MTPDHSALILALGILTSSFFGSWHCGVMCGPIAVYMASKKSLIPYHLGRLISYVGLGVAAGFVGQFFLNSDFILLRYISAFVLAGILIASGLNLFREQIRPSPFSKLLHRLQVFNMSRSGFVVGLLTAFLPCGWLYTYVTAAIASRSPYAGALMMFLFWLGGLPALSAVPMMIRQAVKSADFRQKKIAGGVLIAAGIYSIVSFFYLHH
jgi:sulfite exporter TauE/SafE